MNFSHLEYAVAVAHYGSVSKAARSLFLSQPYLSSMIRSLEAELGYQIFVRSSAGISLTPDGEQFIAGAQTILAELKKIRSVKAHAKDQSLNISSCYSTYIMNRFLQFRDASPEIFSDNLKEMGNDEVLQSVCSGDSSLGILFFAKEAEDAFRRQIQLMGLRLKELLISMSMYVILSPAHPLAGASSLTLEEISGWPYVSYDDSSSIRYLNLLNLSNNPRLLKVSDRGSFYDALNSGSYLSLMAFSRPNVSVGLTIIPISGKSLCLAAGYVIEKRRQLTGREKAFLSFLNNGIS